MSEIWQGRGLTGLNPWSEGCFLSEDTKWDFVSLHFPDSRSFLSLVPGLFLHLQRQQTCISLIFLLSRISIKAKKCSLFLIIYIIKLGPYRIFGIFSHFKVSKLNHISTSLWPCKTTYIQGARIGCGCLLGKDIVPPPSETNTEESGWWHCLWKTRHLHLTWKCTHPSEKGLQQA